MNDPRPPATAAAPQPELQSGTVHLPAPTAWPFMMALGVTLIGAALVTSAWLGYLGAFLTIVSIVGWCKEVLPHEKHEHVPVVEEIISFVPGYEKVRHIEVDETHRAQLPLDSNPHRHRTSRRPHRPRQR